MVRPLLLSALLVFGALAHPTFAGGYGVGLFPRLNFPTDAPAPEPAPVPSTKSGK